MKDIRPSDKNYIDFLQVVKSKVIESRIEITKQANQKLIYFYWWLDQQIVYRQVVELLAKDMRKAFPNTQGFSARNLWQVQQFYKQYRQHEFLLQAVAEIPWSHNLLIISKVKDTDARIFYINSASKMGWTRMPKKRRRKRTAHIS